jgi:hypothetical protein
VDGVLQVEMGGQRRQVIGVMIHVVTVSHLSGPAMTAAIMSNNAKAFLEEEQHLRVPVIGRQRPAVGENDRLSLAPILVIDVRAITGFYEWYIALLKSASLHLTKRKGLSGNVGFKHDQPDAKIGRWAYGL